MQPLGKCKTCSCRCIGASGSGRGRGCGGGSDSGGFQGGVGGPTGLYSPNDWSCPMCANISWAKRLKCHIHNTFTWLMYDVCVLCITEAMLASGEYNELDEGLLEETK